MMKVALYELWGGEARPVEFSERTEEDPDYVRVSEVVEVHFLIESDEIVIPKKLAALDARADIIRADAHEKIDRIEEQRKKLLALPSLAIVQAE